MTIRSQILLALLLIISLGFYYLYGWVVEDLEPQYRKSTEEPLVDISRFLASFAASRMQDDKLDVGTFAEVVSVAQAQRFEAQIYDFVKTRFDLRIYLTDRNGIVLYDSLANLALGQDYSTWLDVSRTLKGEYGARTSHEPEVSEQGSVMYVAAPIKVGEEIVGVVSVGKPTLHANRFVEQAKHRVVTGILIVLVVVWISGILVARRITRPIEELTEYAFNVAQGKKALLPAVGGVEVAKLAGAFEDMRESLEGKKYIENYVQTLTHEVKSPLSAIKGALEILAEKPDSPDANRFLKNIKLESERIHKLVERLLMLSSLEKRQALQDSRVLKLEKLIEDLRSDFEAQLSQRNIVLVQDRVPECWVECEEFLMRHAFSNLLQNAIDFSADGSEIKLSFTKKEGQVEIEFRDHGAGIPNYAAERIFERFYSLQRPCSGKKSSGLGLSIVREIIELHGGSVTVKNAEAGGVSAIITLPL